MRPKPFSQAKNERKSIKENLRIKNTKQRNLVTDQNQDWIKGTTFKS